MPWVRPVGGPGRPLGGALRKEAGAVGVPVGEGQDLVQALMGAAWWLLRGGTRQKQERKPWPRVQHRSS